jgi:enterochelin esterase-like enzyme
MALALTVLEGAVECNLAQACELREETLSSVVLSTPETGPVIEHYLVVLPKKMNKKKHYGAVYFLHGRGNDRHMIRDLGICEELDRLVDERKTPFVVVAPDGGNNYWMNGALTHERWGDLVTQELIQDAESKYPLISAPKGRILAGISMGGHGAIQLSLNNPGVYGAIGAHSPVFRDEQQADADFYPQFGAGADYQDRDPISLMMIQGKRLNVPIYVDMGAKDPWISRTQIFADDLQGIGYKGELHVGEDPSYGHEWDYWLSHLHSYVEWYSRHLSKPQKKKARIRSREPGPF